MRRALRKFLRMMFGDRKATLVPKYPKYPMHTRSAARFSLLEAYRNGEPQHVLDKLREAADDMTLPQ